MLLHPRMMTSSVAWSCRYRADGSRTALWSNLCEASGLSLFGDLDALSSQRVPGQLLGEGDQAVVELADPVALHGCRRVQQQQAGQRGSGLSTNSVTSNGTWPKLVTSGSPQSQASRSRDRPSLPCLFCTHGEDGNLIG